MRKALKNTFLQNDMTGNKKRILDLGGLVVGSKTANTSTIWIGSRTNGKSGSGTELDPYDGSTADKLDELLPAIPSYTDIRFTTGTFLTTTGIIPKDGWNMIGAGDYLTKIKASPGVVTIGGQLFWVIGGEFAAIQYFKIANLSIDGNRDNQPAFTAPTAYNSGIRAMQVNVYNGLAENVRYMGIFQREGPPGGVDNEGFPFHFFHDIGPQDPDVTHYEYVVEMIGCKSISNRGYTGGMGILAQGTNQGREFTSRIHRCLVYDNPNGVGMGAHEVSDCVLVNSGGINYDTWPNNGIKIHGNRIVGGIGNGINGYSGYSNKDVRIYNNIIESNGACINAQAIGLPVGATTVYIHDNYLRVTGPAYPIGIGDNFVGEIHNNNVNEPLGVIPYYFGVYDGMKVWDNFHEDGSPTPLFYHHRHRQSDRKSWTLDIATNIATDTPDEVAPKILLGQVTDYNTRRLTLEIKNEGLNFDTGGKIEINAHNYQAISWYLHPGGTLSGHAKFEIWTKTSGTSTAIWLKYAGDLSPPVGRTYVNLVAGNILDPTVITPSGYTNLPSLGVLALVALPSSPFVSVDKNRGDDASTERLSQDRPARTIQGALNAAVDGDEIIVGPGIYDETVTAKAGTYLITLQHGAIWKRSANAACLLAANVTCDITVNGDLSTTGIGAACIAMPPPCPNCIFRINGKMTAKGTGATYVDPCAVFHDDGKLYINGDVILGTGQVGLFSLAPASTALLEMRNATMIAGLHAAITLLGTGTAKFWDCDIRSTIEPVTTDDRNMEFTRCTLKATGSAAIFSVSGSAVMTLHEFCHLIPGSTATELSSGPLGALALDGLSFSTKPKEAGTTLSGKGRLVVSSNATSGTLTLT